MFSLTKLWEFVKSPGPMAVVAILGSGFGVYATFFYEKKPELTFEILSNASVYDVRENLSKLEIFYAGRNLRAENKTLRLVSLRITNSGQGDITKGDYDESEPLGFSIKDGIFLEAPRFYGSNAYLTRNIKPVFTSNSQVRLTPVILDAGDYVEAQVLVLTGESSSPSISPLGKIAGVKRIQVVAPSQAKDKRNLWEQITSADSIWIQLARAPVYALFALLLIMGIALVFVIVFLPWESISDARKRRIREQALRKFTQGRPLMISDQFVVEKYRSGGKRALVTLNGFLETVSARSDLVTKTEGRIDEDLLKKILRLTFPVWELILAELEEHKLAKQDGIRIVVEADLLRALKELAELLGISLEDDRKGQEHAPSQFGIAQALLENPRLDL